MFLVPSTTATGCSLLLEAEHSFWAHMPMNPPEHAPPVDWEMEGDRHCDITVETLPLQCCAPKIL